MRSIVISNKNGKFFLLKLSYSDKYFSQSKLKIYITKWNVEDYHPMIDTGIIKDRKV